MESNIDRNMTRKKNFLNVYDHWPLIAYLAITILIFRPVIFCDYISINLADDCYNNFYAHSYYFVWAIKQGILPFWDVMTLCGHPYGTDPPSNFNILNFMAVFFGPKLAFSIRHILCVFLAGYFTYVYARSVSISKFSAFVCGAIYMFTGIVIDGHYHSVCFFIPLIFLCIEKAVTVNKSMWIVLASILTTLYFFNSNPQYVLYIFVFSCCYIIYRHYCVTGKIDLTVSLRYLIIFAVLSFGFSAILFFRLYESGVDSQRTISFHTNSYSLMPPSNFITTIIPYFYESPFRPTELNFFFGRFWIEAVKKLPAFLGQPSMAYAPYVGVFGFILGILAFVKRTPKSIEKFFGWYAVITVVFMSTSFLWHIIIRHIPMLNQLCHVQRTLILYEFSLAILAGVGMDILLKDENKLIWLGTIKRISKIFIFVIAVISVVFPIVNFFVYYNKSLFFKTGRDLINKHVTDNPSYIGPPELYDIRLKELYQFFFSWTNVLNRSIYVSVVIIILCVFVLYLYRKGTIEKRFFRIVVIFLILGDLFIMVIPDLGFTPAKDVAPTVGATRFLKQQPGIFRVFKLQDVRDILKPMAPISLLKPNTHMFYGLSSIEGSKSLTKKRYIGFIGIIDDGVGDSGFVSGFQDLNPRLISLMNVKYVVTTNNRSLGKGYKLVHMDTEYRIYENKRVLPRAFMVYRARFIEDDKEILETLLDPGFELDKEIILEEKRESLLGKHNVDSHASAQVQIIKYEPHIVNMEINTPKSGYLFFGDCYDPGWKVYIDGERGKIYRADYTFRAIALPKGKHNVNFVYKPFTIKLGLIFNVLSVLLVVGIAWRERYKKVD